jgi:hypothetical protein
MSSVLRGISQSRHRNLTINGVATLFQLADIKAALSNGCVFNILTPTLYIARSSADLNIGLTNLNGIAGTVTSEAIVQDIGPTIRIGLQSDPNILVLRLVRRVDLGILGTATSLTGYVIVDNKSEINNANLTVNVVSPSGIF